MYLVLFVLHDPDKLDDILDDWESIGVSGVTILHSTGLGRERRIPGLWDDIPLFPSLRNILEHEEYFSRTLFTVLQDETLVNKVVDSVQKIIGNLDQPDTGLLLVIPVMKVFGLVKRTL